MEWTKVTIETTTYGTEIVIAALMGEGITNIEIIDPEDRVRHLKSISRTWDYAEEHLLRADSEDAYVVFYTSKNEEGNALIERVHHNLTHFDYCYIGSLDLTIENANEESWANEWKKYFKPLSIGNVVIVPDWESYSPKPDEIILKIDPGSAFGTGQHQTTKLCILALQELFNPHSTMLDIGCGSGILSILGLLLGAKSVFACDIDPAGAISATKSNSKLNPVDMTKISIHSGDILTDKTLETEINKQKYDIITANIVADVVAETALLTPSLLNPRGIFIASGIITDRLSQVESAFTEAKLKIIWQQELEGWHCIAGTPL